MGAALNKKGHIIETTTTKTTTPLEALVHAKHCQPRQVLYKKRRAIWKASRRE
tara:strand:+ start:56 stop:214 length:159 start_codon:yes stop_codon:yes gene_type:complete